MGSGAERVVVEDKPHVDRTLYVITTEEATVDDVRALFRPGDAIEVGAGESLDLRPLTDEVRLLSVVFADDQRCAPHRTIL